MNKKILVLAFVSAAFFFGCSADGSFNSNTNPPGWDGIPSTTSPSTGPGEPGPNGGENYCSIYIPGAGTICAPLQGFTAQDCIDEGGQPVGSCD